MDTATLWGYRQLREAGRRYDTQWVVRSWGPILCAFVSLAVASAQAPDLASRLESARALRAQGAMQAAAKAYEALLPLARSQGPEDLAGHILVEAAQVDIATGDYDRAGKCAAEAAGIFGKRGDHANEGLASNNIGLAHLYSGRYADARVAFRRSVELDVAAGNADGEITARNNLGNVDFFQGRYLEALHSYQEAARRLDETGDQPWKARRRAITETNLATLYEQLGQYETALDHYRKAQNVGEALPASERAQLLSNLGTLYRRLGDPAKALTTYRAAQDLFAREQNADGAAHVLENIGIALALDYRDLNGARREFDQALTLAQRMSNQRQTVLALLFRGELLYRMGRLTESQNDFENGLEGARKLGASEEQWTAEYGLGRIWRDRGDTGQALALFQGAVARIESVRSGLGASSLKAEFLANKRDVYDACIELLLQSGVTGERLFALMEQARSRNLQDALRRNMGSITLQAAQAKLAEGSLLVEYWVGRDGMAAFWANRKESGVVAKALSAGDRERLTRLPETLALGSADWRGEIREAGALLLSGIPIGQNVRQALIVPDGILQNVPFEALGDGAGKLLVARCAVSYLPSAALLLGPRAPAGAAPPWRKQLVAFGDPVAPSTGPLPNEERWARLPEAGAELRSVASVLQGRAEIHAAPDDLKKYLTGWTSAPAPLLHFATHALIDTRDSNRSRMLFTPEKGDGASEYLFWREAQGLRLGGAELVTLSACDTEGGKMVPGEGIQSFSRAFLAAGAQATVTTLWRVADGPTAQFMKLFYAHLARGENKADALRGAKLSFLHSGGAMAAPQFWAAFVLNGDGQLPVRAFWSWSWIVAPLLLLAALSFLYHFRRYRPSYRRLLHRFRRSRRHYDSLPDPKERMAAR